MISHSGRGLATLARAEAVSSIAKRGVTSSADFMKKPFNEPILDYRTNSTERQELDAALKKYQAKASQVPIVIGDQQLKGGHKSMKQVYPFDHASVLAEYSWADQSQIEEAIRVSIAARNEWQMRPLEERANVLLKAADLASGKYRADLNATTMLGQAKNVIQAEIDAACELIDFFRFNAYSALELAKYQPISTKESTNTMHHRALEGFIAAVSPFNFTAIGGNLASAPALMGNGVVWKPSDTAVLSNYVIYNLLREAGLPAGVVNFVPCDGPVFGKTICASPDLAAINFTGSVPTFRWLWQEVGRNLNTYKTFPRLVGECGGKNFHFVHPSADLASVAPSTIRSAWEYQGQKCSACSRMYVPKSAWGELKQRLIDIANEVKQGSVGGVFLPFQALDKEVLVSAVIDGVAFKRISAALDYAKSSSKHEFITGGGYDDSKGFFIEPTIIETTDANDRLMKEELFGPVLTVYVYDDAKADTMLKSVKDATPYGLTGAVYSQDKKFLNWARDELKDAVGNLYLNDKSTGSVVGQQPFGGARLSGTNDKAGGPHYCLKWSSPQTIKQTHVPLHGWKYPSME